MYKHKVSNIKPFFGIEGPRFVGKTFLIDKVSDQFTVYKQQFAAYCNGFYSPDDKLIHNSDNQLFHYVAGSDITLMDMHQKGLLQGNYMFDRLFLSNAVFAVQSNRLTMGRALEYIKWIDDQDYLKMCHIVYIDAEFKNDNRNKDQWSIYDGQKTREIYEKMLTYMEEDLQFKNIIRFTNKFTAECPKDFYKLLYRTMFNAIGDRFHDEFKDYQPNKINNN